VQTLPADQVGEVTEEASAQAEPDGATIPASASAESVPTDPSQIKPEFARKVGHSEDYSVVTGQVYRVHVDGGRWVVRFAPLDEEDRYGGSIVLAPAISLGEIREGDLVRVHGEILDKGRASKHLGGPLYRALTVELVERSQAAAMGMGQP
jgi:hypothetical protein